MRNAIAKSSLSAQPVVLTREQMAFVEAVLPALCVRGGWRHVVSAAGPDHVHVLLQANDDVHGKDVRKWLKRWLTQALNEHWTMAARSDGSTWFTEGGSTKPVLSPEYFERARTYIWNQRATGVPVDVERQEQIGTASGRNAPARDDEEEL